MTQKRQRFNTLHWMLLLLCCVAGTAIAQKPQGFTNPSGYHWVGSWGASPSDPTWNKNTSNFSGTTVRQVAHLSMGTPAGVLRLHLTNSLGTGPITFTDAHVAMWAGSASSPTSAIVPGTDVPVTFSNGSTSITLPMGAEIVSDPVTFTAPVGADIMVSLYTPTGVAATVHSLGQTNMYCQPGDNAGNTVLSNISTYSARPYLSGIDVLAPQGTAAIVALGDSITDGKFSTVDGDNRWPDDLGVLLQAQYGNQYGIVNAGIYGNKVLADTGSGQNALERFNRDVLAVPGVEYVILLEGINDIGSNTGVTAQQLIQAYYQLIARAHAAGIYIYAGTLTPDAGTSYYSAANEAIRQAVNTFIRTSGAFDGVIDFDAALADPNNPTYILNSLQSDRLHPNITGYQAMANAVNLSLFNPATR